MSRLSQKPVRAGESALQWRFFSTKEYGWSAYRLSDCMIEINLWAFYVIGYRIHRVADPCFPLLENSEMWSILNDAKTTVKDLCEHNPLQFSRETRDAMTALQEKIDEL